MYNTSYITSFALSAVLVQWVHYGTCFIICHTKYNYDCAGEKYFIIWCKLILQKSENVVNPIHVQRQLYPMWKEFEPIWFLCHIQNDVL